MLAALRAQSRKMQEEELERKKSAVHEWREIEMKLKMKHAAARKQERLRVEDFLNKVYDGKHVEEVLRHELAKSMGMTNEDLKQRQQQRQAEKAQWA